MSKRYGSAGYAIEELRAELSSAFTAGELGIPADIPNHASYIQNSLKPLKDSKHEIFRAAADAQRIVDMVLGFHPEYAANNKPERPEERQRSKFAASNPHRLEPGSAFSPLLARGEPLRDNRTEHVEVVLDYLSRCFGDLPSISQSRVTFPCAAMEARYSNGGRIRPRSYRLTTFCVTPSLAPNSTWLVSPRISRRRSAIDFQSSLASDVFRILDMYSHHMYIKGEHILG